MAGSMNFNFLKRFLSALILSPLLVLLLLKGSPSLIFSVILFCGLIAWYEWCQLFDFSLFYLVWGGIILTLSFSLTGFFSPFFQISLFFIFTFFPFLFIFNKESFTNLFFPFLIGLIYLYVGFFPFENILSKYPRELLLLFFLIIFTNDTGAYLAGKLFGRHPFFPKISPKKTWEGFWGGILLSLLSALIFNHYFSLWSIERVIYLVLALSLAGVMGDLFESSVKRTVGKKDSGALIPGHGGLLDRIDGVIFASPVFLFFLEVLGYGNLLRLGL